ncbi:hypothetical protein A2276_05415 [candidate division WOR-1 bacterium RIFOXYA12_FULL_43_27]|uniref:DUF5678 domain-containing protein n=1 Tax=candidate division WOR-1 bacterium RIFOXYC2_FULL_46_14 TaxID=1802587 RepID=A0A1F4U3W4_UNCSA|nr:MAG: hypothetical protein A2276_05415 [candidate division WOR-1 bacterium RIFOXYA12_FULL_43_27]OGC20104.1 MAG: hypothetical protein A2292_03420 [candidate division WOR-1 bacterium RIFOXYB2_FULL_46_45]OGC32159.1 MAG: hypothetical protein A2232_08030 [candidate division WOR-1 bacterium RIFOXYA2_FULL_46_56]OGC39559.1 MAG: hypothetical protein A2438_08395 [candidate division WOR-1 bacterium RIFOXYC2_FULL_46_14]
MTKDRFIEKSESIYSKVKTKLEKTHKGDVIAIEPGSADYTIGKDTLDAALKAKKQHPNKIFYFLRIGFPSVHKLR